MGYRLYNVLVSFPHNNFGCKHNSDRKKFKNQNLCYDTNPIIIKTNFLSNLKKKS